MNCNKCNKWAGAHATLPGQSTEHLCMCPPQTEQGPNLGGVDVFYPTEQEPVAYIKAAELEELKHCNGMSLWAENAAIHTDDSISKQLLPSGHVPVYTTPPQRTAAKGEDTRRAWVGLTDDEINDIVHSHDELNGSWELIDMVKAKLKEKNT